MRRNQLMSAGKQWGLFVTLLAGLTALFSACKKEETTPPAIQTINELITNSGRFTLLKTALTRAGMDGTLGQAGTYTLFAPTDDAFKAFGFVDAATINALPAEVLKSVLQYHMLSTRLESSAIPAAINTPQQTMLASGGTVYISKVSSASSTSATSTSATSSSASSASTVSVNGAQLLGAAGTASNGVVYAINRVLLPPIFGNVVQTIQGIPQLVPTASFKLLQAAVTKAGVGTALAGTGPITVFAPTDAAFRAVGYDSAAIAKATPAMLTTVLSYHVLNSRTYTPLISNGSSLSTIQGGTITAGISTTSLTVTGKGNGTTASNITVPDITATNGVVHIIDRLLLPQ